LRASDALCRGGSLFEITADTRAVQSYFPVRYLDAVQYLQRTRAAQSIVNSSIAAAIRGEFGDQHAMERTRGNNLFINPLMSLLWAFDLNAVAERNLYLQSVRRTETLDQLSLEIEAFRSRIQNEIRPWVALPM